jgi:Zn-dependent metalloprotease
MSRKTFATAIATAVLLTTVAAPGAMAQGAAPTAAPAVTFDAKAAADNYLKQNAAKYNLKSDLSDLQLVSTTKTDAATYVRYQQTIGGVEVFYNQVTVTLDRSGNAILAVSDYQPVTSIATFATKLTDNEAEGKAIEHLKAKNLRDLTSRKFGFLVVDGVATPTFKITVHSGEPFGEFETYVHAGTGKVLKSKDLLEKVNGTGKVFQPNPVATSGNNTLKDNANADSTALSGQLKTVTLQGLDGTGYLKGQYVSATQKKANTLSSTFTYNFNRSQLDFENVMVYYHIDTVQRYIQSLGFTNVNNRQIVANVNGTTADNSFYSPSTKQLTFGTGGVDDAEDAGVIIHEYGHSIQDNQVPGFGATAEGGAMGEGFGDYLGASYEAFLDNSNPAYLNTIAEWDATSYSTANPPYLRRLDEPKAMPGSWVNEVHADGEMWSHGEFDMFKQFGRDVATKIILQSHWSLTPNSGFNDGARAIKAADQALYGGAHAAAIDSIWAARGISTK